MGSWADQILLLGVATARIAAAFLLLPIFASDTVPAMVRNSIFVAFGIVSILLQPALDPFAINATGWASIFIKEAFVGLIIGLFFGTALWALEAAGMIVDTVVGATISQIVDPLSGNQVSLNGAFFARLANVIFVATGGLSLVLHVLMESYVVWPIAATMPRLDLGSVAIFEGEFGRLMVLAALFAAPILIVLFLIDAGLGLVNRFAQQLNVFTLSMSIKSFAATTIILLLLGSYTNALVREISSRPAVIDNLLQAARRGS